MTSKILQTLEGRKLLTRSSSPDDGRLRFIELTEAGRALVARSTALAKESTRSRSETSGDRVSPRTACRIPDERATTGGHADRPVPL